MSEDARFEDGEDKALNIGAFDKRDLEVVSSLVQDSILPTSEIKWLSNSDKLAILINRFRWEDTKLSQGKNLERVRSLLMINHVKNISSSGFSPKQKDRILSILSISFDGVEGGSGSVLIVVSGNGGIRVDVDALEINLRDVTMPYIAPSGLVPEHKND